MLTQKKLKQLLRYDPATGIFTWLVSLGTKRAGSVAGSLDDGYVRIRIEGKLYRAQRLAHLYMTGAWPSDLIDHRIGERANNAWDQIRPATHRENGANQKLAIDNQSGFKGVTKFRKKWRARIVVGGQEIHLGLFATSIAAHAAYTNAAGKYFGAFARAE